MIEKIYIQLKDDGTLEDLVKNMCHRERIRQIENKAFEKFKSIC